MLSKLASKSKALTVKRITLVTRFPTNKLYYMIQNELTKPVSVSFHSDLIKTRNSVFILSKELHYNTFDTFLVTV